MLIIVRTLLWYQLGRVSPKVKEKMKHTKNPQSCGFYRFIQMILKSCVGGGGGNRTRVRTWADKGYYMLSSQICPLDLSARGKLPDPQSDYCPKDPTDGRVS